MKSIIRVGGFVAGAIALNIVASGIMEKIGVDSTIKIVAGIIVLGVLMYFQVLKD